MNGTGDDQAKQNHADITGQVSRVTRPFLFYRLSCDFTLRLTSLLCHLAFFFGGGALPIEGTGEGSEVG